MAIRDIPSSTLTFADLYGGSTPGKNFSNMPSDIQEASGSKMTNLDLRRPAYYWVALIALLVAVRILIEYRNGR